MTAEEKLLQRIKQLQVQWTIDVSGDVSDDWQSGYASALVTASQYLEDVVELYRYEKLQD